MIIGFVVKLNKELNTYRVYPMTEEAKESMEACRFGSLTDTTGTFYPFTTISESHINSLGDEIGQDVVWE